MKNIKQQKVAITGLGLMCGAGFDLGSSWEGIINGKKTIRHLSSFDTEGLSPNYGVQLPDGAEEIFKKNIITRSRRQMTRGTKICISTAGMAIADSGLDMEKIPKTRIGTVIGGTGTGYANAGGNIDRNRILKNMASAPAAWISLKWKLQGPSYVLSTACSSGAYALHSAFLLITSGECDVVISGAGDSSLNYPDIQGFSSLLALAEQKDNIETSSKPFSGDRDGFVMGEGGGMLVMESMEHAEERGARIYATMKLPGLYSETYNIMSPEPGGRGMAAAMENALRNSNLEPDKIDYINAHGTSTILNDKYETLAIKGVFGKHAENIPVSSTKSTTGHCLAGTAGIEAVICCKALNENIIPPTMNLKVPDPELDLDYVPDKPRKKDLTNVLSNSFAFGGHNGVCIFSKYKK